MIAVASDHAGLPLKLEIIKLLEERGLEYRDYGTYTTESCVGYAARCVASRTRRV